MNETDHQKLRNEWLAEDSELGLWEIVGDLRGLYPQMEADEFRTLTIQMIRPLLEQGVLHAVDLLPEGKVRYWKCTTEETLERIENEWRLLDQDPNIGDIVWFLSDKFIEKYDPKQ